MQVGNAIRPGAGQTQSQATCAVRRKCSESDFTSRKFTQMPGRSQASGSVKKEARHLRRMAPIGRNMIYLIACTAAMGGHGDWFSREYAARNGDSERISVVYRCRTNGAQDGRQVDEIAHCARNALSPTPLGPRLAKNVANRPDKCRQGNACISNAWGVRTNRRRGRRPPASWSHRRSGNESRCATGL